MATSRQISSISERFTLDDYTLIVAIPATLRDG